MGLLSQALVVTTLGAGVELDVFLVAFIVPGFLTSTYAGAVELGTGPIYTRARAAGPVDAEDVRRHALRRAVRGGGLTAIVLLVLQPLVVAMSSVGAEAEVSSLAGISRGGSSRPSRLVRHRVLLDAAVRL